MKRMWKRAACLALAAALLGGSVMGCGSSEDADSERSFTWWIVDTDSEGTYYSDYEENPGVQWLNNQYWDGENSTIGTEENGQKLSLSFQVPVSGSEQDNFNTMIGTGEYPEIIDLAYAQSTPKTLCEEGVLIDLTEYVEQYMPNYVQLLEENPDLKNLCTVTDEDGKVHYYAIYTIADTPSEPWEGFGYRRDWIVEYAEPTEYVWDWESEYVKTNGHPAVTPLSAAQASGNMEGWKLNEVTEFTYSEGDDPNNDYTDNVIFPSGKSDPYTISDWEWMMKAFEKAIQAEGYADETSSYCVTIPDGGYFGTGDLASSFGEGGPLWSVNSEGETIFGGTSENFRTYLECMNTWYENGWMDTAFETRTSDMFWQVNLNGFSQGMVGMQCLGIAYLGTTIRETCTSEFGQERAMVYGASLPVNDTYGTDAQKFHEPDTFYQGSRITGAVGLTSKCEGKDMETLFAMFNWLASDEGSALGSWGLSKEQYESMEFDPDVYGDIGVDCAYTVEEGADGKQQIIMTIDQSSTEANALRSMRMQMGRGKGVSTDTYTVDNGRSTVAQHGVDQWLTYTATGFIMDYDELLTEDESNQKASTNTSINDYMAQNLPQMIKNGFTDGDWENYCNAINAYDPDAITQIYNQYTQ